MTLAGMKWLSSGEEPVRIAALIKAVLGLAAAFGLTLSDQQNAAIIVAAAALLEVMAGELTREKTIPASRIDTVGNYDEEPKP